MRELLTKDGITFPLLDEWGTPTEKLPDCPRCGEDELGVIHPSYMMCYACGWCMMKSVPVIQATKSEDDATRDARQESQDR